MSQPDAIDFGRAIFIYSKPTDTEVKVHAATPAALQILPQPARVAAPEQSWVLACGKLAAPLLPEDLPDGSLLLPDTIDLAEHGIALEAMHREEPLRLEGSTVFVIDQAPYKLVARLHADSTLHIRVYLFFADTEISGDRLTVYAIANLEDQECFQVAGAPALDADQADFEAAFWNVINPNLQNPFRDVRLGIPDGTDDEFTAGSAQQLQSVTNLLVRAWLASSWTPGDTRSNHQDVIYLAARPDGLDSGGPERSSLLYEAPDALIAALTTAFLENRFVGLDSSYDDGPPLRQASFHIHSSSLTIEIDDFPASAHEALALAQEVRSGAIAWLKDHQFTKDQVQTIVGVVGADEWPD